MNPRAAFGFSVLMSMLSSSVFAVLFASPWLRASNSEQALIWLVAPHMFLRFIGLSFLVPGVVSGSLRKRGQCLLDMVILLREFLPSSLRRRWHMRLAGQLRRCGSSTFGAREICCSHFIKARASTWSLGLWALGSTGNGSCATAIGITRPYLRIVEGCSLHGETVENVPWDAGR
jgi:hypothetical protein